MSLKAKGQRPASYPGWRLILAASVLVLALSLVIG
jgi:hypothetical protein